MFSLSIFYLYKYNDNNNNNNDDDDDETKTKTKNNIGLDKSGYQANIFLISPQKTYVVGTN